MVRMILSPNRNLCCKDPAEAFFFKILNRKCVLIE